MQQLYILLAWYWWAAIVAGVILGFTGWSFLIVGHDGNEMKYPSNGKPSEPELDEIEIEISK